MHCAWLCVHSCDWLAWAKEEKLSLGTESHPTEARPPLLLQRQTLFRPPGPERGFKCDVYIFHTGKQRARRPDGPGLRDPQEPTQLEVIRCCLPGS